MLVKQRRVEMFEYIDFEIVKAVLFSIAALYLLLASTRSKKKPYAKYYHLVALLLLSSIFIIAYMSESKSTENIKSFTQGRKLECQIDSALYSVSKEDAWVIEQGYFVRESLMIRADECHRF